MDNPSPYQTPTPQQPPQMMERKSSWPIVLGIFGLIFGIFGILNYLYYVGTMLVYKYMGTEALMGDLAEAVPEGASDEERKAIEAANEMMTGMFETMVEGAMPQIVGYSLMTVTAIILTVGSILLLNRNRKSKPILVLWAYAKIVVSLYLIFVTHQFMSQMVGGMGKMFEEIDSASGGGAGTAELEMVKNILQWGMSIGLVLFVIWLVIFPVITLITYHRDRVKEEMATSSYWK